MTLGAVILPFDRTIGFYCSGLPLGFEHKTVISYSITLSKLQGSVSSSVTLAPFDWV
jgi:hypothetical protein